MDPSTDDRQHLPPAGDGSTAGTVGGQARRVHGIRLADICVPLTSPAARSHSRCVVTCCAGPRSGTRPRKILMHSLCY